MTIHADPFQRLGPIEHFEHGYNRVAVSLNGRLVATGDVDMNVVVREREHVVYERNFGSNNDKIRPMDRIRGLAFSPDADTLYLAAGSLLYALSTSDWRIVWTFEAPRSFGFLIISPIALDVASTGDVAAAFDNGSIIVWDRYGNRRDTIRDNDAPRWLRFAGEGSRIMGSDSFSLCRWDLHARTHKLKIVSKDRVFALDADAAGHFAVARTLSQVEVWDLEKKHRVSSTRVGLGVPCVAIHPAGKYVAYAEKNRIRIIDRQGEPVDDFIVDATSAIYMAFSPVLDELLIGCTEKTLIRRQI